MPAPWVRGGAPAMAQPAPPAAPTLIRHPPGITTVDAKYVRPHFASVHILQRAARAAISDTGATAAVPLTLAALEQLGIPQQNVDLLFLTHVPIDLAGGAGR